MKLRSVLRFVYLTVAAICAAASGCSSRLPDAQPAQTQVDQLEAEVRTFCGACHVTPLPEMFPKSQWYDEVRRGYDFYHQSGRHDLKPPIQAAVTEYFRQRAPDRLQIRPIKPSTPSPVRFRRQKLFVQGLSPSEPSSVSFVGWSANRRSSARHRSLRQPLAEAVARS